MTATHFAILQYRLGDLQIMTRHKVNLFLPDKTPEALFSALTFGGGGA